MLRERNNVQNAAFKTGVGTTNSSKILTASKVLSKQIGSENEITIRLVGDVKENIHEIVSKLSCSSSCRESVEYILTQYGRKIEKLREQRNLYREMLITKEEHFNKQLVQLSTEIMTLKSALEQKNQQTTSCEKCICSSRMNFVHKSMNKQSSYAVGSSTNRFRQEYLPFQQCCCQEQTDYHSKSNFEDQLSDIPVNEPTDESESEKNVSSEEELLIDHETENREEKTANEVKMNERRVLSIASEKTIGEQQLVKLMLRYNFSVDELQTILMDYENEHRLAEEMFDSPEQRDLYRLGQKMQKDFWNKKVMHDVKKLSMIKSQALDLQTSSN